MPHVGRAVAPSFSCRDKAAHETSAAAFRRLVDLWCDAIDGQVSSRSVAGTRGMLDVPARFAALRHGGHRAFAHPAARRAASRFAIHLRANGSGIGADLALAVMV
jgi:hypothetical protein